MRKSFWRASSLLAMALVFSNSASAATGIAINTHVSEGDFIFPPFGVDDRQFDLTGNIEFTSTLSNGTYGISDIAHFSLNLKLLVHPTVAPPGFYATADYAFTKADLTGFGIVFSGGSPVSAFWTLNTVSFYQHNAPAFNPGPASVDFDSEINNGTSYYLTLQGVKTLVAKSELDAELYDVPAVPEPASWAMMITGFALVGALARRRKARVAYNFA